MSQTEKLLVRMRANPVGWTIKDVAKACRATGLTCANPSDGSHYKISHPSLPHILTVPFKRPIKPVYVR